jgi:hypothetical protein
MMTVNKLNVINDGENTREVVTMIDLTQLTTQELEGLIAEANKLLAEKKRSESEEFEFEFSATNDPRKGMPYVARLYWEDGKLQREFFDLHKEWGKKEVTVSGTYKAKTGDIIEIRTGGSWKNDYRAWYLVTEDGEQITVADIDNSREKARVTEYLQGKISASELLNK